MDISVKIDEIVEETHKGIDKKVKEITNDMEKTHKKFDKKIEEAMNKNERNRSVPIGQK